MDFWVSKFSVVRGWSVRRLGHFDRSRCRRPGLWSLYGVFAVLAYEKGCSTRVLLSTVLLVVCVEFVVGNGGF
ncbi:unnamed protein product [Amaranthus hypochondriacus]